MPSAVATPSSPSSQHPRGLFPYPPSRAARAALSRHSPLTSHLCLNIQAPRQSEDKDQITIGSAGHGINSAPFSTVTYFLFLPTDPVSSAGFPRGPFPTAEDRPSLSQEPSVQTSLCQELFPSPRLCCLTHVLPTSASSLLLSKLPAPHYLPPQHRVSPSITDPSVQLCGQVHDGLIHALLPHCALISVGTAHILRPATGTSQALNKRLIHTYTVAGCPYTCPYTSLYM